MDPEPATTLPRDTPPFLLRLFHRTGGLIRSEDLERPHPPPHIAVYARLSDTLTDLALSLAAQASRVLPEPVAGTRLVFQLAYHAPPPVSAVSARGGAPARGPQFVIEDLGSVVFGGEHTGGMREYGPAGDGRDDGEEGGDGREGKRGHTLEDARLVVGDHVVVAIMPPLGGGAVASSESAKRERDWNRRGRGGRGGGGAGGGGAGGGGRRGGLPPAGDWRKGEALPLPEAWERSDRRRGRGRW